MLCDPLSIIAIATWKGVIQARVGALATEKGQGPFIGFPVVVI